jgi:hypothetical protein
MLKSLLGSIVTLFSPLSTQSLSKLVNTSREEVNQTLDDLHAILDIPKDQTCPLRLHHPSFRDFLLNKKRCGDLNFYVDEKRAHQMLAENCAQLLSNSIKQDICGQEAPGILVAGVTTWLRAIQIAGVSPSNSNQIGVLPILRRPLDLM